MVLGKNDKTINITDNVRYTFHYTYKYKEVC